MGDIQRKMGTFSTTTSDVMFGITKALVVVVAKQSKAKQIMLSVLCFSFFFFYTLIHPSLKHYWNTCIYDVYYFTVEGKVRSIRHSADMCVCVCVFIELLLGLLSQIDRQYRQ